MIRVILVDDEEEALNLLEILLRQVDGVSVVGRYRNPALAIEDLASMPVDAVFLDYHMPGMLGMDAARIIRKSYPLMPIIFTTAYREYAVEAFEVQSTDYLLKPFSLSRLQSAVSRIKQALPSADDHSESRGVQIRCMGGFQIALPHAPDKLLSWKTNKEKEVCAYLIHHGGEPVDTALLIESIWSDYDLVKAKSYVYTCLSYLRKNLLDLGTTLRVEKGTGGFSMMLNGAVIDASILEESLKQAAESIETSMRLYGAITDLYKGDYLEGCDYRWAAVRREELRLQYLRYLRGMYVGYRESGQAALAIDSLQRVLKIAPESEADGRELIRCHLEAGNRHDALRVYRRLEHSVRHILEADLEDETIRLYHTMKLG